MTESEGTIRFRYDLIPAGPGTRVPQGILNALNGWREIFRSLNLLGRAPGRYDGYGFGNLSVRNPGGGFFVTASQTSGRARLDAAHVCLVTQWDLERFAVCAVGENPPSSEALTHAMMFEADAEASWVFHGHSPDIWHNALSLELPRVDATAPYGTAAMATAVRDLMRRNPRRPLVFTTDGHEDGVFAVGASDAGGALINVLAEALAIAHACA